MATIEVAEVPEFETVCKRVYEADSGITYISVQGREGTFSIPFSDTVMRGVRVMEGDKVRISFDVEEGRQGVRLHGRTVAVVAPSPGKP